MRDEGQGLKRAWLPEKPHENIPGSIWLPNVGYGSLDATMTAYFRRALETATDGDKDRALVFYCKFECWHSWNAVQRAASLGYRNLYWYPGGSTGWREAGYTLTLAQPLPLDPPAE